MKSVWVLEKFYTKDDLLKDYEEVQCTLNSVCCDISDFECKNLVNKMDKLLTEILTCGDGMWKGFAGKVKYSDFCDEAKDCLVRDRHYKRNSKFRVVKAEIDDNDNYWYSYVNPIVNDGVMRYLYATYSK